MDVRQIEEALSKAFDEENHRIVFWNDPEQELKTTLGELELSGVEAIDLAEVGALEIKIRIEREDPEGRYLLYSASEEPEYENDWLLDIRLYSKTARRCRPGFEARCGFLEDGDVGVGPAAEHLLPTRRVGRARERCSMSLTPELRM